MPKKSPNLPFQKWSKCFIGATLEAKRVQEFSVVGRNETFALSTGSRGPRGDLNSPLGLTPGTGYANEVGEAFRSIVPKFLVHASYGIASLYVLADTYDKTMKAEKKERESKNYDVRNVAKIAADTLSWQALASVIIPGFVINRICALSLFALTKTRLSCNAAKWTTTAIGLSSIPFIVTPIDTSVDYAFDKTLRPFLGISPKHSD